MSTTAEDLRRTLKTSIVRTELQHAQVQLRLVASLLACTLFFEMVDPAMMILQVPTSVLSRVAVMTHQPELLAGLFLACAVAVLPYAVMQLLCPDHPRRRDLTKLACAALAGAGLLWICMAYTARLTDFPYVVGVFLRTGVGAFLFALTLALSLNCELARTLLERE